MFGKRQGTIAALCSGALDASTIVFLVIKVSGRS